MAMFRCGGGKKIDKKQIEITISDPSSQYNASGRIASTTANFPNLGWSKISYDSQSTNNAGSHSVSVKINDKYVKVGGSIDIKNVDTLKIYAVLNTQPDPVNGGISGVVTFTLS